MNRDIQTQEKKEVKHTPTPWWIVKIENGWKIMGGDKVKDVQFGELADPICQTFFDDPHQKKDMEIIVHSVNSHKDLLETIRWMAQTFHQAHHLDQKGTFRECPKNTCDAAIQAIARAEGKEAKE